MGLPNNFNKTINLKRRVEALNDLTFYLFEYDVKLTDIVLNEIISGNRSYDDLIIDLGEVHSVRGGNLTCKNRISALTEEQAENKFNEWIGEALKIGVIENYHINRVTKKSFNEELEDKNLMDILETKKGLN